MTDDIPLKEVQILWDYSGREPDAPSLLVIGERYHRYDDYLNSWGCCNAEFIEADDIGRLEQLFAKFVELVTVGGLDPRKVHDALLVVPEYREAFGWSGLGSFLTERV